MDNFAKATRNNDPTRRYLKRLYYPLFSLCLVMLISSKPEGFLRIPARGETRWSSLFRELTKFCEMFPFLDAAVRNYSDHSGQHGAVPGFDKLEEWFSPRECKFYTLICDLLKPVAEVLKILEGPFSCLTPPSLSTS